MYSIVFSIVTVVKNAKNDLEKTLNSIRQQTYPHIEYIVVDGMSNDGTLDVINKNFDIINKWISEPDRGIYDAMNKGKALASGNFLLFINAGDIFSTNTVIEDIHRNMNENKNKLYYGKVCVFNRNIKWEYKPHNDVPNKNYLPHHQGTFYPIIYYKKESYDTRFKIIGDVDFTLRASQQLEKCYIPITTVKSEFNGFGVLVYSHVKGVRLYIKDHLYFINKHPTIYSWLGNLKVYSKAVIKYIAYKIGGSYLINIIIATRLKCVNLISSIFR
jgi:glycosyltransferase involved in cell wall biosynthesis